MSDFYLKSGRKISSISELQDLMGSMSDDDFSHHVNLDKNDFSNWVRDVFKDEDLASELSFCSNKAEMDGCLTTYMSDVNVLKSALHHIENAQKLLDEAMKCS